jgi:peptide/nickel transport system substrate-binding protein
MVRSQARLLRGLALGAAVAIILAACSNQGSPSPSGAGSSGASAAPSSGPGQKGGTIYVLTQAEQIDQIDPQRMYTGEDLALFGGTIYRSLVAYKFSADAKEGTSIVPDLATDLGTPNADATQWKFTLRDGVTFQDGSPITCEDIKYGVSRTFATDVINQGPTYAIAYLNIPQDADGSSSYKGPYKKTGQADFDKAVTCDGKTITFNLNKPVPDFNYTVTLGFSPVPAAADTGETYGTVAPYVVSSGPYKVESYNTGNGGKMILVRNDKWDPASDPYRPAYPDKWEIDFGIDPKVMDQRLMASTGNDTTAIQYGNIQPENLGVIFSDVETPTAQFTGRAVSGFDPYSRYYWVDVNKVKNVKIRQAMAVALDRAAIRLNIGGAFAGDYADGVIKPNIGVDYAPTGFWDSFFGQKVPDSGDPALAKKLITESGEAAPKLTFDFADTPTNQKTAAIVISSLGKAGFTVTPNPIEPGKYYTQKGGWDLSQLDDKDLNAKVEAAQVELDRTKQAALWQALNKQGSEQVYIIPTFFGLSQTIAGTKVGPIYRWPAYGSWPYGEMYVKP